MNKGVNLATYQGNGKPRNLGDGIAQLLDQYPKGCTPTQIARSSMIKGLVKSGDPVRTVTNVLKRDKDRFLNPEGKRYINNPQYGQPETEDPIPFGQKPYLHEIVRHPKGMTRDTILRKIRNGEIDYEKDDDGEIRIPVTTENYMNLYKVEKKKKDKDDEGGVDARVAKSIVPPEKTKQKLLEAGMAPFEVTELLMSWGVSQGSLGDMGYDGQKLEKKIEEIEKQKREAGKCR